MKITHDLASLVDDLAAHWTEAVLEILKSSGIRSISVDMEIEAWRTLKRILYTAAAERGLFAEIVRQPAPRLAFKPSSGTDFTPRLRVSPTPALIE